MDFKTLAAERYSVRKFKSQVVEAEKIDLILETARLAPTAGNRQPQRIAVIRDAEGLARIDACTSCRFGAPVVFIICYDRSCCWVRPFDGENSGQVDASIITTHMMLQAQDLGLGTTWVMHFDPVKTVEAFALSEQLIPVAMLILGYPADDAAPSPKHMQRQELEKMLL
jgi:nitroreductase